MMPWDAIGAVAKLLTTLLEGIPPEQRRAEARIWFYLWWPMWKHLLSDEAVASIEAIMATETAAATPKKP